MKISVFRFINNSRFVCRLLLFFVILFFAACENDMEQIKRITTQSDMPNVAGKEVEIVYTESGKIKLRAKAPELMAYTKESTQEPYTEFPKGLEVWFYDDHENLQTTLTAQYAKYYEKQDLWEAKYKVKLLNSTGDELTTEHLFANLPEEKIYTDKYVQILNTDGSTVQGEGGFESNFEFTKYTFRKVEGLINFNDDK